MLRIAVFVAVAEELSQSRIPEWIDVHVTGIGPVEAAIAAGRVFAAKRYDLAISCGIAGGYAGRASVGDAVLAERVHFADIGREDGSALALPPGSALVDGAHSDLATVDRVAARYAGAVRGAAICSARITTSDARAAALIAQYPDACSEDMESFAVVRAAERNGVPALVLRGISNIAGDRSRAAWDFRAGAAAAGALLGATFSAADALSDR